MISPFPSLLARGQSLLQTSQHTLTLTLSALALAISEPALATTYYIAPTGSGTDTSSSGISESKPFATLAYAAGKATAGDTLLLLPGTYYNTNFRKTPLDVWKNEDTIRISNLNGNANAYITIRAKTPNTVIIKGDSTDIFQLRTSSYVKIEDLIIEGEVDQIPLSLALEYQFQYKDSNGVIQYRINPPGQPPLTIQEIEAINNLPAPLNNITRPSYFSTVGLLVQSSHHIEVNRCTIHHCPGVGLRFQGCDNFKAQSNIVHNCSRRSSVGNHGFVVHSLNNAVASPADTSTGTHVEIVGNLVYENYNEVYSWSELKSFITPLIDEGKGISMQKNSIANGWQYGRVLIANNCCWSNGFSGIHLNEGLRMDIINNTCYNNSYSGKGPNTGISLQTTDDVTVRNNISVAINDFNGQALNIANSTQTVIANNLIYGSVSPEVTAIQQTTTFANPNFVSPTTANFKLQANSPAIGQANSSYATASDLLQFPRTAPPDLGAYEFIPNALHLWRMQYFQSYLNTNNGSNTADPNANGNSNLVDFAFGINPSTSDSSTLQYNPTQQIILSTGNPQAKKSNQSHTIAFIRRKDAATLGMSYAFQSSPSLAQWSPATPTSMNVVASNTNYEVVEASFPAQSPAQKAFYRIVITLPEPN